MPKYSVTANWKCVQYITVDAENEQDAIEKADELADITDMDEGYVDTWEADEIRYSGTVELVMTEETRHKLFEDSKGEECE